MGRFWIFSISGCLLSTAVVPAGAAAVVANSPTVQGRGQYDLAIEVNRETTSADEYPIVLVSYHIGCVEYQDAAKADAVKAFEQYVISEKGQQAAADAKIAQALSETSIDDAPMMAAKTKTTLILGAVVAAVIGLGNSPKPNFMMLCATPRVRAAPSGMSTAHTGQETPP